MYRLPQAYVFHGHCLSHKFFLATAQTGGTKWGRQERERPLESKLKRLGGGGGKLVKASHEPIKREWLWLIRNRVCFTLSVDNNSDILMLIKIIFD